MGTAIYKHLDELNAAYDHVIASLQAFERNAAFNQDHLKRLGEFAREAKATSNAYLTGALHSIELANAGRWYRRRHRRERRDEGDR